MKSGTAKTLLYDILLAKKDDEGEETYLISLSQSI